MSTPRPLLLLIAICAIGCTTARSPVAAPEPRAAAPAPGHEILWVRDAAEYRAALLQTYRLAAERVEVLARGRQPGTWAVVLDADETVISNLGYSLRQAAVGERWTEESWQEWVLARQATAIPGAVDFIDQVRRLGGRVAIVTNRAQEVCDATRENLEAVGVELDVLRCRDGEESKEARWQEVRSGDGTGLGPVEIVMWVGDNIRDFPGMDQSSREFGAEAFEKFGVSYFVLPNPLYGSWEPGR